VWSTRCAVAHYTRRYPQPDLPNFSGNAEEQALEWLSSLELLQAGYEHQDSERLLDLFAIGTREGESVLKSTELSSRRDACHMTVLDVAHEHFDDYNLEQLATGKCLHIYPRSMSRVEVEFVAAFVCLHSPGPVSIHLPAPVRRPIVLAGRMDCRGIVLTDSTTPLMLRTTTGDLAHSELDALLGGESLNYGCNDGCNDGFEGQVMGLDCSRGSLCLSGEMLLEGLRLLMEGARWWYGRGASRAVLLTWLRCQQEQDEPAGVAHALGVV
jgi:hypothetical protein